MRRDQLASAGSLKGVTRVLAAGLLGAAALFGTAVPALADASPSATASTDDGDAAPTQAGTSFRTATEIRQGQRATADGSTGDYLYWSVPADAGQRPTVKATVKLPESATRQGASTWQLDVYDGLRRRQACQYGAQTRTASQDAGSVDLSCTLRTVRAWSEPWANDPLPGTYYVRLTVVGLQASDLGLPVEAAVEVTSKDVGGSAAVDGALAKPLVPGIATASEDGDDAKSGTSDVELAVGEPEDGWASGWWSDRWLWTAAGGVLAALAGVGGYSLTRGSGRPARVPPGV
ncbi:hypothetical protein ABT009_13620 [Streptomyces sp. NPDC002896]|uniref:hypothetical protein n=1 Tax=Streptomyces sp. NPDC002896 TaxID=3154438 RepID=UPI00332A5FF1